MITLDELRWLFKYEPETGNFIRLVWRSNNAKVGSVAGTIHPKGYIQISVGKRVYKAHRLAWLYMTGEWPVAGVDHRDMNPANNRWHNLREATQAQNSGNVGKRSFNTSGFKGVTFDKSKGKWMAQIQRARRCHHLGYYETPELAHAAYVDAAKEAFGDFARAE